MLTPQEKEFYASNAWAVAKLSNCDPKHGAVVVKRQHRTNPVGNELGELLFGYNREIIKGIELPPIIDALSKTTIKEVTGGIVFSTKFPSFSEVIQILTYGLSAVFFFGDVDDPEAVRLINEWNTSHNSLEMVRLEVK